MRQLLKARGCVLVGTEGDHEKWRTPGGLSIPIVAAEKDQSPGTLRSVQRVLAPEFGDGWLEKDLAR